MPVLISEIKAPLNTQKQEVLNLALRKIPIESSKIRRLEIFKTSLDARKRDNIHFVHTVYVELADKDEEIRLVSVNPSLKYVENNTLKPVIGKEKCDGRVVVAGLGPAGVFCARVLA